jgi:hypothetical protein
MVKNEHLTSYFHIIDSRQAPYQTSKVFFVIQGISLEGSSPGDIYLAQRVLNDREVYGGLASAADNYYISIPYRPFAEGLEARYS